MASTSLKLARAAVRASARRVVYLVSVRLLDPGHAGLSGTQFDDMSPKSKPTAIAVQRACAKLLLFRELPS
jgi:hypothetical protein